MLKIKTETITPCQSKIVEFREQQGDKQTIYRFEFPVSSLLEKTFQRIDLSSTPGHHYEHARRVMTASDEAMLKALEAQADAQAVLDRIHQLVDVSLVDTIYFSE